MGTRLELSDTTFDVCYKMSEGNPGALTVCAQLLLHGGAIDPDGFLGGFGAVFGLDTLGIYGPRIWMLFKDVCGQDLVKMCAVLRADQLGFIQGLDIDAAIDGRGEYPLDCDELLKQVRERLPNFQQEEVPA